MWVSISCHYPCLLFPITGCWLLFLFMFWYILFLLLSAFIRACWLFPVLSWVLFWSWGFSHSPSGITSFHSLVLVLFFRSASFFSPLLSYFFLLSLCLNWPQLWVPGLKNGPQDEWGEAKLREHKGEDWFMTESPVPREYCRDRENSFILFLGRKMKPLTKHSAEKPEVREPDESMWDAKVISQK